MKNSARQELRKQEAISEGLQEKLLTSEVVLTKEQKFELHDLKKTDPEAWRNKLNEYEEANKEKLGTELETIRTESSDKGEKAVRIEQMEAWSESTGISLTDEIVENDLPPRFMKQLENGKITFEEFLDKAGKFLKSEKVIQGADEDVDDDTKNLSKVPGTQEPSTHAQEGDFVESYEKDTIF